MDNHELINKLINSKNNLNRVYQEATNDIASREILRQLKNLEKKLNTVSNDIDNAVKELSKADSNSEPVLATRSHQISDISQFQLQNVRTVLNDLTELGDNVEAIVNSSQNLYEDDIFDKKDVRKLFQKAKSEGHHLVNEFFSDIKDEAEKIRKVRTTEELKSEVASMNGGKSIINYKLNVDYIEKANETVGDLKEDLCRVIYKYVEKSKKPEAKEINQGIEKEIKSIDCNFEEVFRTNIKSNIGYEMVKLNAQKVKVTIMSIIKDPSLWYMVGIGVLSIMAISAISGFVTQINNWLSPMFMSIPDFIEDRIRNVQFILVVITLATLGFALIKVSFAGRFQRKLYLKNAIDNVVNTIKGSVDVNKMKELFEGKIDSFREEAQRGIKGVITEVNTSKGDFLHLRKIISTIEKSVNNIEE